RSITCRVTRPLEAVRSLLRASPAHFRTRALAKTPIGRSESKSERLVTSIGQMGGLHRITVRSPAPPASDFRHADSTGANRRDFRTKKREGRPRGPPLYAFLAS